MSESKEETPRVGAQVEIVDAGTEDDDSSTVVAGSVPGECEVVAATAASELLGGSQHSEDTDSWTVLDNEDNDSPFVDETLTSDGDDDDDVDEDAERQEEEEEEESDSDIETLEIPESNSVQEAAEEVKSDEFVNVEPCSRCSELPAEFPSIEKCHTYIHKPNKRLNALLSSFVVVGVLLVVGFGVGHFLGWSEKLEQLQEEEEEGREESPAGLFHVGVIRRLTEENSQLRLALASRMKFCDGKNNSRSGDAAAAPAAVLLLLRQKINDLLVANADLEKEVARLRYSPSSSVSSSPINSVDSADLLKAKISLNDVTEENHQLKIEVGKARYGNSYVVQQQRQQQQQQHQDGDHVTDEDDDDESGSVLDYYVKTIGSSLKASWNDAKEEAGRFVVGLSGGGGSVEDVATLMEERVDAIIRSVDSIAPAGKKLVSGAKKVARRLKQTVDEGISRASDFLEKQLGQHPSEWKEQQLEKLRRGFGRMANRWNRVYDAWNGHDDDDDDLRSEKRKWKKTKKEKEKMKKTTTRWRKRTKKAEAEESDSSSGGWLFARADGREHRRNEESRSDWVFDRAEKRQKRGGDDADDSSSSSSSDWYENRINRHHR